MEMKQQRGWDLAFDATQTPGGDPVHWTRVADTRTLLLGVPHDALCSLLTARVKVAVAAVARGVPQVGTEMVAGEVEMDTGAHTGPTHVWDRAVTPAAVDASRSSVPATHCRTLAEGRGCGGGGGNRGRRRETSRAEEFSLSG